MAANGARNASPAQKGAIHKMGAECDIYDPKFPKDKELLHEFVFQLTRKTSISLLTVDEASRVIRHLGDNIRAIHGEDLRPKPGAITKEQEALVFRLAYRLQELDTREGRAGARQRIRGVIRKVLEVESPARGNVLAGLTAAQGERLIEQMKRYVRSAEGKVGRD